MPVKINKKVNKWGYKTTGGVCRICLESRNCTKGNFMWDYEDKLDGMLEDEPSNNETVDIP